MSSIKKILVAASVMVLAAGFTYSDKAYGMDEANWSTQITFAEPLMVGDMTLPAGTYEFSLTAGPTTRNVIMIYSVDSGRWEGMVMGVNDSRMDTRRGSGFTFIEARDGSPKMLEYWFYPGWKRGIKILYPEMSTDTMASATMASIK